MRRALLIGADPAGFVGEDAARARLVGIPDDLARVDAALARHGFAHRTIITGDAASRDGILAAFRELIAEASADDAVFVYYTGHGGLAINPDHGAVDPPEPRYFQYIVPSDHSHAKFRGIFSAELTAVVADLTAVTTNVTVALDCCHATGGLMGKRTYRTRAIPRPWAGNIAEFVVWLRQQGHDLSLAAQRVEGNPHALRLVACSAEETASEFDDPDGNRGGVMTTAFVEHLNAAAGVDPPPIWDALGKAIRATVVAEIPTQNPDVLGPTGRRLFTVDATETRDIFAMFVDAGFTFLRGGSVHGIRVGDRFLVLPLNVAAPDRELALAELEAELVATTITRVKRTDFSDRSPVPAGARAVRIVRTLRRHLVALDGSAADPALAAAIAASPRLAIAGSDEQDPLLATVTGDEQTITILDVDATPVRVLPAGNSSEHAQAIVGVLEQLARVRELLDLRSGEGPLALDPPGVEWAIVLPEGLQKLPHEGAELHAGDQFAAIVAQPGSRSIYVSILGVMPDRSIALLSASEPQGVNLAQGEQYVLGQDRAGLVVGIPIPWPDVVPAVPQPLELVVVATDFPVDLRPLAADLHDVNELIARVGKLVIHLGDEPAPRECRLAVVRRSARVAP